MKILERPENRGEDLDKVCKAVFDEVKRDGDEALKKYTWYFDRVKLECFEVTEEEFQEAEKAVKKELKEAIRVAKGNIEEFHRIQIPEKCEYVNERGFRCWQEGRAIDRVGLYVPGGSAPLFSTVLMLAVPAKLAGCREVVICTPPGRDGRVNPAILWTARLCGVTRVFKVGGIQAIAALALGTESVGRVDKIFGPGNRFVTAAKQWVGRYGVAIDMPAGPSELMVVADESARASFVAADLLSQAEHDKLASAVLLTTSSDLAQAVQKEITCQTATLERRAIMEASLKDFGCCIVCDTLKQAVEIANEIAPEHLELMTEQPRTLLPYIRNAGAVFLGDWSPEPLGDYLAGPDHVLPTSGTARFFSPLSVDSFLKTMSVVEFSRESLSSLQKDIITLAESEQLTAHANAIRKRFEEE